MSQNITVFDIGGSIVAPEKPDIGFLKEFLSFFRNWLNEEESRRAVIVVGGGGVARAWQEAVKEISPSMESDALDWVGVMATRLNAEMIRALLGPLCPDPVVCDPTADFPFKGRVLMAAGWKPGFSTDYDAVVLAERFDVDRILMLSNIAQIHDSDPTKHPEAKPISRISWKEYRAMTSDEWKPGANIPFDPKASRRAEQAGMSVLAASGRDLKNLKALLNGQKFTGTLIYPNPS